MKPHRTHPPYCGCIDCRTRPEKPRRTHSTITNEVRAQLGLRPIDWGEPTVPVDRPAQYRARASTNFLTSGIWQGLEKVRL